MQEAVAKINSEMAANNNPYVQVIGQFLLQHLEKNPQDADKILKDEKSILNSLEAMRKVAEEKMVGNCAVLTDQEGFAVVLNYFEMDGQVESASTAIPAKNPITKTDIDFDVKLEDYL